MPILRARRFLRYAGKPKNVGDVFEASGSDAKLLVALGRADYHVEEVQPKKRKYRRSDMQAEE